MAFDRIAATLNAEGVTTRTAGKSWHGFTINRILKRAAQPLTLRKPKIRHQVKCAAICAE
ncbi:hypothetical protein SBA4_6640002 [Candidatus Sulfopaludibacter sp. SbA4]|nr:hypothetical protein SBA4_6640002 [Candidatus Sulfopaludibacter sp. SbA4]